MLKKTSLHQKYQGEGDLEVKYLACNTYMKNMFSEETYGLKQIFLKTYADIYIVNFTFIDT